MCKHVWLLGGSGGISPPPKENFEFRSSQIASDTIWDKLAEQHILATIIIILNFKISGGGIPGSQPLCMKPCCKKQKSEKATGRLDSINNTYTLNIYNIQSKEEKEGSQHETHLVLSLLISTCRLLKAALEEAAWSLRLASACSRASFVSWADPFASISAVSARSSWTLRSFILCWYSRRSLSNSDFLEMRDKT